MESKPSGKMDMSQIQAINKVKYALPSNLNIVERRTNKVNFADQNAYSSTSGNEIVIRLQASTDYVYGPNSYLVMDVESTAAGSNIGFVKNTAMALFDRCLYESKDGAELERNDSLGRYVAQVCPLHWSDEYTKTGVANAGQFDSGINTHTGGIPDNNTYQKNGTIANYNTQGDKLSVVIPLHWFLGVFGQETLIPSMLVSGSLIRLQLARAGVAFEKIDGNDEVASYSITNPRVVLDALSLSPVVQKNLMEQSQSGGGLDYCYETVYYQSGNPGTQTNFNLQVNKAVSRCQKLYWSSRAQNAPDTSVNNNGALVNVSNDSLGTAKLNVSQLDYRLGDLFFPQRVITVDGAPEKNGAELYENTLQSIHRMKTSVDPPSISKDEFCRSGTPLTGATNGTENINNGKAVHCQSFEMSSALEYSGLAINNSRTLEARINFVGPIPAGGEQVVDAWICYLKLAKCNQMRAIIKE
jgi:hypothetical protein